jgi:hypothetical protein
MLAIDAQMETEETRRTIYPPISGNTAGPSSGQGRDPPGRSEYTANTIIAYQLRFATESYD